jgi:hypothetical protein
MVQQLKASTYLSPLDGPFSLEDIKNFFFCKCIEHGILEPLKRFLRKMVLVWGDTPTAHAEVRNGVPYIVLGREFFANEVKNLDECADILLHEIQHHLRVFENDFEALRRKFSENVINLGEDAIINAAQHVIGKNRSGDLPGFARFMERFYKDEGASAFLRPNSKNVKVGSGKEGEADPGVEFYRALYNQEVTLEEACEFFVTHFPKVRMRQPLLGSHGQATGQPGEGDGQPLRVGESIFSRGEGLEIMRALGLGKVSRRSRDNFKRIVQDIMHSANKPGSVRTGVTFTRKMPAKLSQSDLISIERGREVFRRPIFKKRKFKIFFDVSGSMESYIPFVAALIKSLRRSEFEVELYCWADTLEKVEISALGTTAKPKVGAGTRGEEVAEFLATDKDAAAVIITDNLAGQIETRIKQRVYVCLVPCSSEEGSFLDKAMVPNSSKHKLLIERA